MIVAFQVETEVGRVISRYTTGQFFLFFTTSANLETATHLFKAIQFFSSHPLIDR